MTTVQARSARDVTSAAREAVEARFGRTARATERFFEAHDEAVARACLAMARRFQAGGRLLVSGRSAGRSDAQHVAVEFVHPVIVGKRALPAVAVGPDVLPLLARPDDLCMVLAGGPSDLALEAALADARRRGLLTLVLGGPDARGPADWLFRVEDDDPLVVQEVVETLYHVLWELVHVFLDRGVAS